MPTANKSALVFLVLLGGASALTAPGAERRNVVAHGNTRHFWVSVVEAGKVGTATEQSQLQARQIMDKDQWQAIPPLPARVLSISSQGTDLSAEAVLLLENRAQNLAAERLWAWFSAPALGKNSAPSEGRYSYGPVLPRGATLVAVAGGRNPRQIWAIGKNAAASTAPSTRAAPPKTNPSAASNSLTLFSLEGQEWTAWQVNWPAGLDEDQDVIPMIVLGDGNPVIAAQAGDEVRIHALNPEERAWSLLHAVKVEPAPRHVKLINMGDRPALWVQPEGAREIGSVWTPDGAFQLGFNDSGALPKPADMDVTFAGDEFRLVFRRDNDLFEKGYGRGGSESKPGVVKIVATNRIAQPQLQWVTTAIMAVFTVLIISTLLRRRAAEREDGERERDRDRDRDRDDD